MTVSLLAAIGLVIGSLILGTALGGAIKDGLASDTLEDKGYCPTCMQTAPDHVAIGVDEDDGPLATSREDSPKL